ncbi:MAG: response regulator transcription factor [Gemmatimonadetes bacterium]|nr:response regulator transcription factor [Gemmatimonadota bacterium]
MTGIYLSAADVTAFRVSIRALLTPDAHSDIDAWRMAVLRDVERFVGADLGAFMIWPAGSKPSLLSDGITRAEEYIPRVSTFDVRFRLFARQEELVVWSRASLWGRHFGEMCRSAYYQEWVIPVRAFDAIGLTIPLPGTNGHASLNIHHDSPRATRFGDRGLTLLSLLEPAFRTGMALALEQVERPGLRASLLPPENETPISRMAARSHSFPMLTARERQVVTLLAARRTNAEIGCILGVARGTAKRHVENVLRKIGLTSRRDIEPLLDR